MGGNPPGEHGRQLSRLNGFAQKIVHAGLEAQGAVARRDIRRHGDDGQMGQAPFGLQPAPAARGLMAPQHRHLHVHQDQVKGFTLAEQIERLLAVVGEPDAMSGLFQAAAEQHLIGRVVIDHQHGQPGGSAGGRGLRSGRGGEVAAQGPRHGGAQRGILDRFGQVTAQLELPAVFFHPVQGAETQHEDRDRAQVGLGLDPGGQGEAVPIRHLDIEQDEVRPGRNRQ